MMRLTRKHLHWTLMMTKQKPYEQSNHAETSFSMEDNFLKDSKPTTNEPQKIENTSPATCVVDPRTSNNSCNACKKGENLAELQLTTLQTESTLYNHQSISREPRSDGESKDKRIDQKTTPAAFVASATICPKRECEANCF